MSFSAAVERTLFRDKDGGASSVAAAHSTIIRHRFFSFLIWQFLQSTLLLFISKSFVLSPFTKNPFTPNFISLFSFLCFHFALILFSTSIFFLSSPHPLTFASPIEISVSFVRLIFVSGGGGAHELRKKIRVSLSFVLFTSVCAMVGAVSVTCLCWAAEVFSGSGRLGNLGFRGFVVGLIYGLHYVYMQRWVLRFPIIQRPPFFSFKMGLPSAFQQAVKLSAAGCLLSGLLAIFLPNEYKSQASLGKFIVEQIVFYIGSFVVILSWELSHHLHQVLHTKRFVFAPPKGSAAAETNPSEPLLATLEDSTPKSLLQYLAYLDLYMLCESNVDSWRRAAFFEESGETYKRVITACLAPIQQLTQKLADGLASSLTEKSLQLSVQLYSPTEQVAVVKIHESFYDSQLCAWCAQIVSSLTARSHKEDRFGVAQLSGSNTLVISTLLSCLLSVETLMGKKTNIQQSSMGPAGMKWATVNTGIRESSNRPGAVGKIRGRPVYSKAYTLADILKNSIYCIISSFHDEMMNSSRAGSIEKDWIVNEENKPIYGSSDLLIQKMTHFLDFKAS